jgi:hypothetical protein
MLGLGLSLAGMLAVAAPIAEHAVPLGSSMDGLRAAPAPPGIVQVWGRWFRLARGAPSLEPMGRWIGSAARGRAGKAVGVLMAGRGSRLIGCGVPPAAPLITPLQTGEARRGLG